MNNRKDIHKIMIIGSGPIVIGQACEFDYSGTQACKALKSLGYSVVLVNSNPATIMTDPELADATYIEPLNAKYLETVIAKEQPDALLPNFGGQSALNLCSELYEKGVLDKYNVEVIGVSIDVITKGEDRIAFKELMESIGVNLVDSEVAFDLEQGLDIAEKLGYPVVLRPAFTMGGTGGGLVNDEEEFKEVCARGLTASPIHEVLIEKSILGWEELELEVVRDLKGKIITVCFIENIDPIGIHTGDSFCCAPMLTISKEVQKELEILAHKIIDAVGVVGGSNVQFARDPKTGKIVIIEINPRTSRSSALASKATGFPIAMISAMLATGITLDELECGKYGTLDKYIPEEGNIVLKFARWAFEKFEDTKDELGTQMKAVGEAMSIGKTFKEAYQKVLRSLEIGKYGPGIDEKISKMSTEEILKAIKTPSSKRYFMIYEALKRGESVEKIAEITSIKNWFLEQMKELAEEEKEISCKGKKLNAKELKAAKESGFSDKYLSLLTSLSEEEIRKMRIMNGITSGVGAVHVSGTKDKKYYFSSYHINPAKKCAYDKNKVLIVGSGPNRIGQGIEFDYCCVHASLALKKLGFKTVLINCNPETVSTDYDISDTLYFEPVTAEDVLEIYHNENPLGAIVQFGGQTPLNISSELVKYGVKILGTQPSVIDEVEDRDLFRNIMEELEIPMPESGMASCYNEAKKIADEIHFPVMVRPSFVLGGRGMEVVYDDKQLEHYMKIATDVSEDNPVLIDRYLQHAIECELDAVTDGDNTYIPAIMEHVEYAGIHSGDSACYIPSVHLTEIQKNTISNYTVKLAKRLGVLGLLNIQFAVENGKVYVIEANPRASRTVPLISKVCGLNAVKDTVGLIMKEYTGRKADLSYYINRKIPYFGVKEAVLPHNMLIGADPILSPEMHSTGEVLGVSSHHSSAFLKATEAVGYEVPSKGKILMIVNQKDMKDSVELAKEFIDAGYTLASIENTYNYLKAAGIKVERVYSMDEGLHPNTVDLVNDGTIQMVVNTPIGHKGRLRKAALSNKVPCFTTLTAAKEAVLGIMENWDRGEVKSIQELHNWIRIYNL